MKIGFRLTIGFLPIVLLVGVVGYIGFSTTNTIKEQSSITAACGDMMIGVLGARETLQDYLLTDDVDELAKIKEEHLKYHENSDMWIKALGHGTDSDEFKSKYLSAPDSSDGKKMILKFGRYGKFWAHPDYPKIKETSPLKLRKKCPECGESLVERKGRWGKIFIGCSGYPECKYIKKSKFKSGKATRAKQKK